MKWTTLDSPLAQGRLHDGQWMLAQMQSLLELQKRGRIRLGSEGYLSGHPHGLGFDRAITMSAWVGLEGPALGVLGAKWVSSCVRNNTKKLPRGRAVTLLNCAETGLPLLGFNGTALSNARTAAFACAAIAKLYPNPNSIALIGAGRVHAWQARYIRTIWPDTLILVHDPDRRKCLRFQETYQATILQHWEPALMADVVSFATAGAPLEWLPVDAKIEASLVINTSLRDIAPTMFERFDLVVVDDRTLAASQDTPYHVAVENGTILEGLQLCDIHLTPDPSRPDHRMIVNPMGMAAWDVGLGYLLLKTEYLAEQKEMMEAGYMT